MENAMMNFSQQAKLLDPMVVHPVTLIGAGAVGSYVAITLAKMGVPKLTVWDDDEVSGHNIPMSAYRRHRDLMRPKVTALREIVEDASGLVIDSREARWQGHEASGPLQGVVVACVDDMDERQRIWQEARENPGVSLLIDTRTAGQLLEVFAVNPTDPDDIEYYDHYTAFGKKEAKPHMCGRHGLAPISLMAAAAVGSNLTAWWMSGKKKRHHRQLVIALDTIF